MKQGSSFALKIRHYYISKSRIKEDKKIITINPKGNQITPLVFR